MKRDLNIVRQLLLDIEKHDSTHPFTLTPDEKDSFTNEEMQYHLFLMHQAGLISGQDISTFDGPQFLIKGMTWQGHEFLEAARNDQVWNAANDKAEDKGMDLKSLPFEIAKELLFEYTKRMFFPG